MPSLSSLIVQRQVASIVEVEQAIARQVIHGGDLVTNLLEVAPQSEHSLTRVLAESLGIPSVPPGRLPAPENDALDIVPVETALRYGVFPLRLSAKTLVIATSERLKPTAAHDLAFTLGLDLSQVAAPLIRIREGIAAHYGVPLEPRQLRLVQRLDGLIEGAGGNPTRPVSVAQLPGSLSLLPSGLGSGVSSHPAPIESTVPTTRRKVSTLEMAEVHEPGEVRDTPIGVELPEDVLADDLMSTAVDPARFLSQDAADTAAASPVAFPEGLSAEPDTAGFLSEPPSEVEDAEILAGADAVEVGVRDEFTAAEVTAEESYTDAAGPFADQLAPDQPPSVQDVDALAESVPEPSAPRLSDHAPPAPTSIEAAHADAEEESAPRTEPKPILIEDAPVLGDSPRPPGMVNRRAVAHMLKREASATRKATTKSARKKGPFSRSDAERELESARSPEDVLDTFFAFGSQFFEYSALFVVHGEIVEGRDAWGPGADHLRVLGLGVPLDLPSSLAAVRKDAHVLLSRFDDLDLDRELRRDLERSPVDGGRQRPSLAALVPLTLRSRSVALLYGDDGPTDVTLTSLGDLLGFSALASAQLERVALARKSKSGPFAGLVAPRAQPSSVAALARAFQLPMPKGAPDARTQPFFAGRPTPSSGTPVNLDPRISPGATSVHPPPRAEPTKGWEDEVVIPKAREIKGLAPANNPALAETEIPALRDVAPATPAPREGLEPVEPRPREPSVRPPALIVTDTPFPREAIKVAASPAPPPPVDRAAETAPPRLERTPAPPPAASSAPPLSEAMRSDASRSERQRFVRPIPRVDDDDASALIAEHVEQSEAAARGEGPWAEALRSTGMPQRESVEPESQNGRIGSYHLVPRPADARMRGESTDIQQLLERATAGGLEGEEALSELLRKAEHEFPQLVERFPGPLVVDRLRARADLPPASECGPLLKVLVTMRRGALPFMTVRSTSPDVEQRFWATHVLGEVLLPEASNAILPRLFDEDVAVRRVARRAAQALATAGAPGEPLKHSLAHTMRNPEEPMQRRLLAIEALSEIRVPSVVPILIPALLDDSDAVIDAGRTALMVVTRQDLGRNPQVWSAWWEIHKNEHRVEWLIQALTHDVASIRRTAGDELKLLTREYFGYYDDLPPKERERAQQRYRQWWQDEGQYRFR